MDQTPTIIISLFGFTQTFPEMMVLRPLTAINLPIDKPFVLIRYGAVCQTVYDMQLHELHIRYDDEDAFNKDTAGGAYPYEDGGFNNHRLF